MLYTTEDWLSITNPLLWYMACRKVRQVINRHEQKAEMMKAKVVAAAEKVKTCRRQL